MEGAPLARCCSTALALVPFFSLPLLMTLNKRLQFQFLLSLPFLGC